MYAKDSGSDDSPIWFKRPEYALIVFIALLYIALIGRYNAFDLDSRWFPSFSHAFWVDHIQTDPFMLGIFPSGMGGVIAFGKLAAIIQGALLSLFGWSLAAATLISAAFVLLSLILLARTCRHLGYSANFTLCYIALLGFTEPFFAASHRARFEFLPVFLLALALWLAARNNIVLSIFLAALATEVEPAAIVIAFAVATFLLSSNAQSRSLRTSQLIARILLGATAAAAVFFFLHPHIISIFRSANWAALDQGNLHLPGGLHIPKGFFIAYYLDFHRHLPELALLLAAIARCALPDKRHLLLQWPALCSAVIVVLATLLHWPNHAYFVFIAPFRCLFVMQAIYADKYRHWILAAILLFTLPQYAHRYKWRSPQYAALSQHDDKRVTAAITRAATLIGKPPDQLNIIGNYALWFAHPHLFVNLNKRIVTPGMLAGADLLLCFEQRIDPSARTNEEIPCADLNQIDYKLAETINLHGQQLQLRIPTHH
jgi:hypothetical protein